MKKQVNKMNPIYAAALNNCKIENSIVPIIEALDGTQQEQAIKYLLGIIDINEVLPEKSSIALDARLVSYDWLNNRVSYSYTCIQDRYFPTQEDADKFSKTSNYDWDNSTYQSSKEKFPYKGTYVKKECMSCTDRDNWIANAELV